LTTYRHDGRVAFLFLLPLGLTFLIFLFGPILASLFISFSKYNIIQPISFVGFKNYVDLFVNPRILGVYGTTLKLVGLLVALHLTIGLILALSVHSIRERYQPAFRIIFYAPVIITTASVAIAWNYMLNESFGVFNYFLGFVGVEPIRWLTSSKYVFLSIAMFSVWKFVGNSFVYYYIGLSSIPKTYSEAARIDGASSIQQFFRIKLPLLTPTIFFVFMILCIQAIQIFDEPFFITRGGPGDASRTLNLLIYETAYQTYNMGLASTIAMSLFLILAIFTIIQMRVSKLWVNYES
jgi:multiple sugar transport system permease protein